MTARMRDLAIGIIVAGLVIGLARHANAATATLSSGASCTYQALAIDPAGNVTVTCAAAPPPPGESCEQFVRRMYRDVLGVAEPDAPGLAFWTGQCSSGVMTRQAIENEFRGIVGPPLPPPPPASGSDLSDTAPHVFHFHAGVPQTFTFTHAGGNALVMLVTAGGSFATRVTDTFPGLYANRATTPIGSDFRHEVVNQRLAAGTYSFTVGLDRSDRFMLQYWRTP